MFTTALSLITSFFSSDGIYKISCIILGTILVIFAIYHFTHVASLNAIISEKDNTITELNKTINERDDKINELNDTLVKKRAVIELQNAKVKENESNYVKGVEEAKKTNSDIISKYKTLINQINSFKGDSNASECDNLRTFGNSIQWMR